MLKDIVSDTQEVQKSEDWKYESRREAQSILPFLYLGPSAAARDIEALKREKISFLLVVRNTRTAQARLLSGDKVANELGIESAAIDVDGNQELIAAFPKAVKVINSHLVTGYHLFNQVQRMRGTNDQWSSWTPKAKVLVFCESGNERSAAVVAAYIMAMYGTDLVAAIQYIQAQRFCVAFDDELKNLLLSYQHILEADSTIRAGQPMLTGEADGQTGNGKPIDWANWAVDNGFAPNSCVKVEVPKASSKRGRDEMADEDDMAMDLDQADDLERFGNRSFAPFS